MSEHGLQLQRFELKYMIAASLVPAVRAFVRSYLDPDPYGIGQPDNSYPIHSLYLDSDALALYWDTINGTRNRYKLRLRYYSDRPDAPVYFEIKRRSNDAIQKQRGAVRRAAVPRVLAGQLLRPEHLLCEAPRQLAAVQRFSELMLTLRARPKAHVAYRREAWISRRDNSVRVTLDRDVRSEAEPSARLSMEMNNPKRIFGSQVILEIKFTSRFPDWLADLVRIFSLERGSAAKYAEGVALLGEESFRPPPAPWRPARSPDERAEPVNVPLGVAEQFA